MIRFWTVLFLVLQMSAGQADEMCQPVIVYPMDPAMEKMALAMTKACTLLDVKLRKQDESIQREEYFTKYWAGDKGWRKDIDLPLYEELTSTELCTCLDQNKSFNQLRIPEDKKNAFSKDQLNTSIAKTLNLAMADLYGNITKFKNLNLPKADPTDIHYQSISLCSPEALKTEIEDLQETCPNAKSTFPSKLKEIFGTEIITELPDKIRDASVTVEGNSCLSKHQYMHLRSSNLSAKFALGVFNLDTPFKKFFTSKSDQVDQVKLNDLLSYDVLFNLSYRDENFRKGLRQRINSLGTSNYTEVYNDIYNDKVVLKQAMDTLQGNCNEFKANVKTFLCVENTPKLNSLPLSLLANDAVDGFEADPVVKQSMRDYITGKFACGPEPVMNPDEKKLSDYVQATNLFRANTFNPVGDESTSEYSRFNDTFCAGRRTALTDELPAMMKDFFDKKKAAGIDLNKFFAQPDLIKNLGLKIDTNADPSIVNGPDVQPPGSLPEISSIAWQLLRPRLELSGLSEIEIDSLYSIIEMQTNVRSRAVNELREEVAKKYPNIPPLSPADLDGLLRGSSQTEYKLMYMNPDAMKVRREIDNLYAAQQTSRMERFNSPIQGSTDLVSQGQVDAVTTAATTHLAQSDAVSTSSPVHNTQIPTPDSPKVSGLTVVSNTGSGARNSTNGSGQSQSFGLGTNSSIPSSPSRSSGRSAGGTSYQSDSNSDGGSVSNSYSRSASSNDNAKTRGLLDDVKRIEDEIARNRARYNSVNNAFKNGQASTSNSSRLGSRTNSGNRSQYNYPRNVPFKSPEGDYYTPNAQGDELSSAPSESKNDSGNSKKSISRSSGSSGGGGSSSGPNVPVGSINFGSGSSGSGGSPAGNSGGRRPASAGSEANIRKQLNLAPFEYHRYIPHSIFDVVGSVDKVVLLLGLEGKSFKTIEAIEEIDPKTEKINIKYIERTFDFVPEGNFVAFKESFSSKEERIKIYHTQFNYERNKENLKLSKKYSLATREVAKEEVPHSHVLDIQDFVLSDAEIRDTMNEVMELLK